MKDQPGNASQTAPSISVVLARLRSNWGRVGLGAAVCALAALAVSFGRPKTYESTVTLMVSPPTFKDAAVQREAGSEIAAQGIGDLLPPALPVEAYKAVALSPTLVGQVIDTLELEDVDANSLRKRLDVELVQLGSRSVQTGIAYAPALLFHVRAEDAEQASALAQAWADVFKRQMDEVARKGVTDAFVLLEGLNARFKEDLQRSDEAIAQHQTAWNMELMKSEVLSEQTLLTDLKAQLKRLAIKLASAEMQQNTLEEELSLEPQKYVYFRAPSDDVYWLAGAEGVAPEKGLCTEEPNQNYTATRTALISVREKVAGLRSERETTLAKVAELDAELKTLVAVWAEQNVVRTRLDREQDSLRVNYGLVRSEYEKGRMAQQTLSSNIAFCGAATTPKKPAGPGHATVALVAALAGALLAGGVLVFKPVPVSEEVPPVVAKPANGSKKTTRRPKSASKSGRVDEA